MIVEITRSRSRWNAYFCGLGGIIVSSKQSQIWPYLMISLEKWIMISPSPNSWWMEYAGLKRDPRPWPTTTGRRNWRKNKPSMDCQLSKFASISELPSMSGSEFEDQAEIPNHRSHLAGTCVILEKTHRKSRCNSPMARTTNIMWMHDPGLWYLSHYWHSLGIHS